MKQISFQTTDWNNLPVAESQGEHGHARKRTMQFEGFRVRIVEYSAGYKADHWCRLGHIVHCLEGEIVSELSDGTSFTLRAGMSYVVSDDVSLHRSTSKDGAKLMIIDGNFLSQKKQLISNPWKM